MPIITCPANGLEHWGPINQPITSTIDPSPNVSKPDTTTSFAVSVAPQHGSIILTPVGTKTTWTYTPSTGFTGYDFFSLSATTDVTHQKCTTTLNVYVVDPEVTILKSVHESYVTPGDQLTYTLVVTNASSLGTEAGTMPATVFIQDTLPANTILVPSTTFIDDKLTNDISSGLTIPNIQIGESSTIHFIAKASSDISSSMLLTNTAEATLTLNPNTADSFSKKTTSNEVTTPVFLLDLALTSKVSQVFPNGTIEYTLTYTNQTNQTLTSALIKNSIPAQTTLVANSTFINTKLDTAANIANGIQVGPLAADESVIILFSIAVNTDATPDSIILNQASLTFSLLSNDQTITGTTLSNEYPITIKCSGTTINAFNQYLYVGDLFNPLYGVTAISCDGTDVTAQLSVEGTVNTNEPGVYPITYSITNADGSITSQTITVTVSPINPHQQAITDIIESVALEQAALSHILNAEGEKLQALVAHAATSEELLTVNTSVNQLVNALSKLEIVLLTKLDTVTCNPCNDPSHLY